MWQLTHRTHIITMLVLASITSTHGMASIQSPINNSSLLAANTTATTSTTTSTTSATTITTATATTIAPYKGRICKGVHIRNDLKSFEQLKDCRIIDGPLTIALVSHINNTKDYDNITFPLLTEITEYLLFFRVKNLTTLSKLFPNLSVIRGKELVSNYALIIYEMMQLQEINLPKLTDILRGSVRIENNPNLCYASTVNWEGVCKHIFTPHFIMGNNKNCNNTCPNKCEQWQPSLKIALSDLTSRLQGDVKELGSDNRYCWNNHLCQETCYDKDHNYLPISSDGGCCSPMCAGGCYLRDRSDKCVACRHVSQGNKCVEYCDADLYEFRGRCIEKTECESMKYEPQSSQCDKGPEVSNYKPIKLEGAKNGTCMETCPAGYEEDQTNKHECKKCDRGKCRKVCPSRSRDKPLMVTDIDSLREIHGCNAINGSLEISLKGGKNVLHELEAVFKDLEEIDGYLKITRSYPIVTLGFLRNLKTIRGSILDREYALVIVSNPNLQELFVYNQTANSDEKHLEILGGRIFVHHNPRLCPHKVDNLKEYAVVSDWDERDVSPDTNGDKETCDTQKLKVEFVFGASYNARIAVENFAPKLEDPRTLLYYLINYRVAPPNGTVTMFDGRDGCNSQNDVWYTIEETPSRSSKLEYQTVYIPVKPATRYALYVKTFTILAKSKGALSDVIYFESAPDTPGIPRQLESPEATSNSVIFGFLPPARPNGVIVRYVVTVTRVPEMGDLQVSNVCNSQEIRDIVTAKITNSEPNTSYFSQKNNTASESSSSSNHPTSNTEDRCPRGGAVETDADIQVNQVTFQDTVIDVTYLKQPCSSKNSPKPVKRKRSIEHDLTTTGSPLDNSLPKMSTTSDQSIERQLTMPSNASAVTTSATRIQEQYHPIRYNASSHKIEAHIPANKFQKDSRISQMITGLHHYGLYTIEVVACHGDFKATNLGPSPTYEKCGLAAVTQVRTRAIPEKDKVNASSIVFYPANDTHPNHLLTWDAPEQPNGLVLAYKIKYRLKNSNSDGWSDEKCISYASYKRFGGKEFEPGFFLVGGAYLLTIRTVSMSSEKFIWSEEIEIEVPQIGLLSTWAWVVVILLSLVALAFAVASGAYCFHKNARDDLIYASVNPDYVQYDPDEWEVDKSKLIVGPQIGTGSFGMVYKGQLITEKGKRDCAVKTVPPTSTAKQRMDFLREASIMKQYDTFHVVKLLGVVSVTTPVYIIMEYMENGDLKDFLRNQREIHQKQNKTLVDGIYLMAAQIADGMAYLAARKFVHRDLAARNCMVGENRIVKIGDFGLTRDIYTNDYYRRDTQGRLPVRWMAPESLSDNITTSASDAWSYGIVLWEMVTFSAYPYQGLSNDEVIKRVIQGYTMPRPEHCPDKLYNIMERCWRKQAKDRPAFLDIVGYLLPETDSKLYPNCFYRKPKVEIEGDSVAQSSPDDTNTGIESYPLLSWPSSNQTPNQRPNCLTNGSGAGGGGDNHINHNHNLANHHNEKDQL